MTGKSPKESYTIMNELVLPNDTNTLNNLMGGRLLHWMDIAAAISAQKHCNRIVVTASVDNVSFQSPIKLGDVISIEAKVTRAFTTSVEVRMDVWAQNIPSGTRAKSNEAYYTFVALDSEGQKTTVPSNASSLYFPAMYFLTVTIAISSMKRIACSLIWIS